MGRGRTGIPLGERTVAGRADQRPRLHDPPEETSGATLSRHVWLIDAPGQPGRWPGLLVEWRRASDSSWMGRVIYALPEADRSGNRVVERWLPGTCLSPVPGA